MSLAESRRISRPGERLGFWSKILRFNWAVALLIIAVASIGFLMLFSVANGSLTPWAKPQNTASRTPDRRIAFMMVPFHNSSRFRKNI